MRKKNKAKNIAAPEKIELDISHANEVRSALAKLFLKLNRLLRASGLQCSFSPKKKWEGLLEVNDFAKLEAWLRLAIKNAVEVCEHKTRWPDDVLSRLSSIDPSNLAKIARRDMLTRQRTQLSMKPDIVARRSVNKDLKRIARREVPDCGSQKPENQT